MKRFYYLVPIIGLAVFSFFYVQHMDVVKQKEVAKKEAEARAAKEEADKKVAAQAKAEEDAAKRAAEREVEEAKKAADREKKHADEVAKVEATIDEFTNEYKKSLELTRSNEAKLTQLRSDREALRRTSYDLAKRLALAQIDRRNAELEIQRYADMVVKKAEQSAIAKIPTPPPAK